MSFKMFEPSEATQAKVDPTVVQEITLDLAIREWVGDHAQIPYNAEAEQAVLGSCLIDPHAIDVVSTLVVPDDFLIVAHRQVLTQMLTLAERGEEVNIISLSTLLEPEQLPYILSLVSATPTSVSVASYARTVAALARKRRLLLALQQGFRETLTPELDADEAQSRVEQKLFELGRSKLVQEYESTAEIAPRVFERLSHVWDHSDELTGLSTGFLDLDTLTNGMQAGDLLYLAGRPSMGKTALALNIAHSVAIKAGFPVGIMSIEMSAESLYSRLLALDSQIAGRTIDTGKDQMTGRRMDQWERDTIVESIGRIAEAPIYIDDTASINPLELRSKARRMHAQHNLKLLIVDYLQLMEGGGSGQGNRVQEVTYISRIMKSIARELNIPLLIPVQLSRAPDLRKEHEPILSDLRESGSLEQDGDIVMFIYRDVRYNPETERPHVADVILAKQRNGPTGTIHLFFDEVRMQFHDLNRSDDVPF